MHDGTETCRISTHAFLPCGGRGKSCLGLVNELHADTTRYDTEYLRQATSAVLFLGDEISVPRWAASKCTLSDFVCHTRDSETLTSIADTHSGYTVTCNYLIDLGSGRLSQKHSRTHAACSAVATSQASLIPLYSPTARPPRLRLLVCHPLLQSTGFLQGPKTPSHGRPLASCHPAVSTIPHLRSRNGYVWNPSCAPASRDPLLATAASI
jgi:hypothetical protein